MNIFNYFIENFKKMKLFQLENNYNYTAKCPDCPSLLKFNIDKTNLMINGECKTGHIIKNITPAKLFDLIKNTYFFKNYCYKCQSIINEDLQNYICSNCDKLFCIKCINSHTKENKNKQTIFNSNNRFCALHNMKNEFFCECCKIHICQECKSLHESHEIIFISENFTYNKKRKVINSTIDEYKKKIENLLDYINQKKIEIDKRFNNLKDFLNCLLYLNEKLLKKFNYSVFDYYNYHNFELFYEFQNNESSFDKSKNMNYIFYGPILNDSGNNKSLITKNSKEEIVHSEICDNFNLCNYQNLKYLKQNIFFLYEQKENQTKIKFFEYKNFTFKLYFEKNFGNCDKIEYIKSGKFNNLFLVTRGKKNKIYIIKHNIIEKNASMEKLYDPYHKTNFNDIIDIKNEYYVVSESKGLKIFYNFYKEENIIKKFKENYTLLNNVNESFFLAEDYYSTFHFFDTKKYDKIKSITFPSGFKFLSNMQNIILFTLKFGVFYFVELKNLEIIQKLEYLKSSKTNKCLAANHNGLFEFFFEKGKIKINKYDFIEGCFCELTNIVSLKDNISPKNIKYIDNKYVVLANEDELEIYSI